MAVSAVIGPRLTNDLARRQGCASGRGNGRDSERTIWPIAIGYLEAVRLLAAWCELRKDFRSFRTDRVIDAVYLEEKYPERRDLLRAKWRRSLVWEAPSDI